MIALEMRFSDKGVSSNSVLVINLEAITEMLFIHYG